MKDQWADWAAAAVPAVRHCTRKQANYKTQGEKKGRMGKPSIFANTNWVISEIVCVRAHVFLSSHICWIQPIAATYFQEMLNVSSLWIIFQTHFNPPISPYIPHLPYLTLFNTPLTLHPHLQEPHSRSVPANQTSGSPAGVMGVGARVWCKHAAADKQIMLSLCCHGWQHTQRGAGALPGRRVHPFSQGGGEGEGEHEGG